MAEPFVALSPPQVFGICAITVAAIALSYLIGLDEGRERFRRQLIEQAREDGVKALRFLRGHDV